MFKCLMTSLLLGGGGFAHIQDEGGYGHNVVNLCEMHVFDVATPNDPRSLMSELCRKIY